jgi:hypothetical protein
MIVADTNPPSGAGYVSRRSRGTIASPSTIVNGDAIVYPVYAEAYDGTNWEQVAQLLFVVDGGVSTGIIPTAMQFTVMDDTGTLWNPIQAFASQDVVVDGIWKNLWANGIFIDGAWNAYGGTMSYPTIAALREALSISGTGATGTVDVDALDKSTLYITASATANWTINLRGNGTYSLDSCLSVGQAVTFQVLAAVGTTPYFANVIKVDGVTVTPKWAGGVAPAGGIPSAINAYTLTAIKTASATFTVLAQMGVFA